MDTSDENLELAKDIYRRYCRRIKYHRARHLVNIGDKQEHHRKLMMNNLIEMYRKVRDLGCCIDGNDLDGYHVCKITEEWIAKQQAKETRLDVLSKKMRQGNITKEEKFEYILEISKKLDNE